MNRLYSTIVKPNLLNRLPYRVGQKLNGYIIRQVEEIKEFSLIAIKLEHEKTNAKHLHLSRANDNINAFCVSFRTTPKNNTGVAHILEHLSLCGSKKYPCRDPFMKMLSRSLATFMNACTGFDMTYYPFSTQNLKDYENLLSVYLDATFYPLLDPMDFLQEGWRLEPEKLLEDSNSKLELKGVVFNEMKDVYADQSKLYVLNLVQNILPDTIYKNDFGGHPFHIPELDNNQIRQFHQIHYHPSNSKFYTYGNQPLDFYLSKIDAVLKRFERNDDYKSLSYIHPQANWNEKKSLSITGPPDAFNNDLRKQIITSKSYLLADLTDSYQNFVLNILSILLTSGQNSPFYQSLVDSGLGSDFSPASGYLSFTKQSLFSVGLQGTKEEDIPKIQEIIEKTLNDVRQNGFPKERIDAVLHLIELESKHQTESFGLNLISALNSIWNQDGDVVEALRINKNTERFKADLKNNPKFLQEIIDKYLIQNKHNLTLSMKPNPAYSDEFKQSLDRIRENKTAGLSEKERKQIVDDCLQLNKRMNEDSNLEVLPCLNVDVDIDRTLPQPTKIEIVQLLNHSVQVAAQSTNQLVYFRALSKIDLSEISEELLPYLSIFCSLLTELAAGDLDRKQMSQQIELNTSGLSARTHIKPDLTSVDKCELHVLLHSYCLHEKLDKMLDLWEKFFNSLKLIGDEQHIQQLIKMNAVNLSQSVVHSGHNYSALRSSHSINAVSNLKEKLNGIEFVKKLNDIAQNEDVSMVIDKLKKIAKIVLNRDNLSLALNAEPDQVSTCLKNYERFLTNLKTQPNQINQSVGSSMLNSFLAKHNLHEHYILPFNSNYVSKSFIGVPFRHSDYAKYKLLSMLLSRKYLHREIREKGSAYGSGLKMDLNGVLSFYSYRDPNLKNTLDVYDRSIDWLKDPMNFSEQDVNEAKLNLFKEIDSPITAGNHGMNFFLYTIDDQTLSNYRNSVFDIKKDDIVNLVLKDLNKFKQNIGVACFGPKSNDTADSLKWQRFE